MKNRTMVEQISERELVLTRTFDGPAHLVFEAWTTRDLFVRWWVPKAFAAMLVSCDLDVRVGGTYRLVFRHGDAEPMAFHGRYTEVVPASRLVWTNEESAHGTQITTVTFEEKDGKTLVVVHERYPSKEAFDSSRGAEDGMVEAFDQLDELLASAA